MARRGVPAGLRWGGVAVLVVAVGYAVALVLPAPRPLLADARAADLGADEIAGEGLVRIPPGTVLWEEVAFRGVLLAVLARVLSVRAATVAAAVAFGLWHIRPTLSGLDVNDLVDGPLGRSVAVALVCAGTAVAGLVFTWLRLRSGSLLAPALLHLATNTLGRSPRSPPTGSPDADAGEGGRRRVGRRAAWSRQPATARGPGQSPDRGLSAG